MWNYIQNKKNEKKKNPKYDYTKLYVKCIAFTTVGMSEWGAEIKIL